MLTLSKRTRSRKTARFVPEMSVSGADQLEKRELMYSFNSITAIPPIYQFYGDSWCNAQALSPASVAVFGNDVRGSNTGTVVAMSGATNTDAVVGATQTLSGTLVNNVNAPTVASSSQDTIQIVVGHQHMNVIHSDPAGSGQSTQTNLGSSVYTTATGAGTWAMQDPLGSVTRTATVALSIDIGGFPTTNGFAGFGFNLQSTFLNVNIVPAQIDGVTITDASGTRTDSSITFNGGVFVYTSTVTINGPGNFNLNYQSWLQSTVGDPMPGQSSVAMPYLNYTFEVVLT